MKLKFSLGLVVIFIISAVLYLLGKQIPNEVITSFVQNAGPWAPIVYIVAHQISYVIAPISGFPFLIAGFYLFGKTVIFYTYFVVMLGASINFWIARKWGRLIVAKLVGKETLVKIDKLSREYGIITLIALRMLQGGVGDYVSYGFGLTTMKFSTYFIVTALAIIPGNIIWYWAVSQTNTIEQSLFISLSLALISSIIFLVGNYLIRKYKKRKSPSAI